MKNKTVSKKKSPPSQSVSPEANKPSLRGEKRLESVGCEFAAVAKRMTALARKRRAEEQSSKAVEPQPRPSLRTKGEIAAKVKLGQVVRLPPKAESDTMLRLEQNLGCELPVCVSNRSDVKNEAIEILSGDNTTWRLERTASSLLPAPEHYPIWLWIVDRCQVAARAGCTEAPRIPINLQELARGIGRQSNGQWYRDVDEALSRFSRMIITAGQALYLDGEDEIVCTNGAFGTLCNYVSWRTTNAKARKTLIDGSDGWVQPGPFLWQSILSGYLKAVPLLPMRELKSYVAQRLYLYLSKHCRPGCQFTVSLNKLLPKIPMKCTSDQIRKKLKPHHAVLRDLGFLAREPSYKGRGQSLMVTYERQY